MSDLAQDADTEGAAGGEWWVDLPADLHGEAKRFKSTETLLRAAMERKQELSARPPKDALVVPAEDSSDEEKASYREKRGIPDSADGYDFELGMTNDPEKPWELPQKPDEEMLGRFRDKAHELGLSHVQAQGIVADFQELMFSRAQQQGASRQEAMQKQQEYLTKTFGENAQSEIAALEPLFKSIMSGGEDWVTELFTLQSTPEGLGNNGLFLRFMAGIRRMTRADRFVDVEQNGQITSSEESPNLNSLYPTMKNWS